MVICGITAVFGFMIPRIIMDNDVKEYFPHDHPSYKRVRDLDTVYGSQILMDIAIDTTDNTILTPDSIAVIKAITDEVTALPHVEKVQSLTNIDYIAGIDGGMSAEKLLPDDFAGTSTELTKLKERIVDWQEMYNRVVISENFRGSQIVINIDKDITSPEMSVLYNQTSAIIDKNKANDLTIRLAGDPVLSQRAKEYMHTDLIGLIPLVSLVVLICLFLSFKNLEGTLLPLITVIVSTVWTVGLMAVTGAHFTVVSSCLPVLLIAVGSAYGIHVINHYYDDLSGGTELLTPERHRMLVFESLRKVRSPVILAGITTIAGFISTITSPIIPLKTFAMFSAIGVTFALILSLTLIPALLLVKPISLIQKQQKKRTSAGKSKKNTADVDSKEINTGDTGSWKETLIASIYAYLNKRRGRLIFVLVLFVGLSIWGLARLNVESSLIEYFPKESTMRRDVAAIDKEFAGTNVFSLVIKGPEKGSLTDPEILKQMDDLSQYLAQNHHEIGKIVSFTDFIKRMNKVMHAETITETAQDTTSGTDIENGPVPDSFFSDDTSGSEVSSFFSDESDDSANSESGVSSFFADESSSQEDSSSAPAATAGTDPNKELLSSTPNVQAVLDLFNRAYARAGGGNLTAGELLSALEKELNYNGADYNEIPYDTVKYMVADKTELKNLISQYLLLYSGSLDQFSDDPLSPSQVRMSVQLRTHETGLVNDVIADAEKYVAAHFPEGYTVEATGIAEMEVALTNMITSSQVSSLLLAILIVFVILSWYFKSPFAGLIGSIPLALSILINFGIMGLTGINLDMVTSLIGSIAIGIGVDYTIHFMNNYHYERLRCDDLNQVTLNTLRVSGKAIVVNAVSVGLGFLVLCLSQFVVLRYIGFLVAVVMLTSSVTAMTILPVLLNVFKPKFISLPIPGRR